MTLKRNTTLIILALALTAAVVGIRAQAPAPKDEFGKGAYKSDLKDLTLPKVKTSPTPEYTSEALRAKIAGTVFLEVVVKADGKVNETRVLRTKLLGATAEDKPSPALIAQLTDSSEWSAKQWTFEPAKLNGTAVPVIVQLEMEFKLR